jgi:hypothetical protein
MGAWGPWENDLALDWIYDVREGGAGAVVESCPPRGQPKAARAVAA